MSSTPPSPALGPNELRQALPNAVLAFRGYNVTNLGRTPELLAHPQYGGVLESYLAEASEICQRVVGRPVDLVRRVRQEEETTLDCYDEAIALIVAVAQAHLRMLAQFHRIDAARARLAYGFSLGEVSALVFCGALPIESALTVPLALAADAVALSQDVTLGVLFSRGEILPLEMVQRTCALVNQQGEGVVGVSAQLSPNSVLLLGSDATLEKVRDRIQAETDRGVHLRKNEHRWPPLHTPIVWNRNLPNRAAVLMRTMPGGFQAPQPPVLSLVTGTTSYNDYNARDHMVQWIDHTQRLWDAVYQTLAMGIETVIHVGPQPNIIPATFSRLATDVATQIRVNRKLWAFSAAVQHPWLQRLLPRKAALLRAPSIRHVVLEDWLLENSPATAGTPAGTQPAARPVSA
jgi:[acyl-carrier-protein] S-malonyltransferase